MSDEQLRALGTELEKRLDATLVRVQRIRWLEDVDDEGEVTYIPVLDELGIGEDAMVRVTWPAAGSAKAQTTQIINLAMLDDAGPEKLGEMLALDLAYAYALLHE